MSFVVVPIVLGGAAGWGVHALGEELESQFLALLIVFALIGWLVRSWAFGIFSAVAFYVVAGMDEWDRAMETLSLVLISVIIATLIGVPLGILAAKSQVVSNAIRPVLDFMQTMPAMVYLIPTLFAFGIGVVPGMISTIVFAMPPGVRLTEHGIRNVDTEVVEAGQAFGSPPLRILRQIQLPLALPTIMAGINQVIMLALSMVVLAAMVGAAGLGLEVVRGLQGLQIPRGAEAGLAVVVLAIFLDRIVAALADRAPVVRASRVRD
ncbi:ABC transporter permease subunit [Actinobacteria bacterium YIM 96077]|uniref:Proline/glycine betaine ABC transporter permease n=2 Tax=Phytoactinopolyspora halophila TaxID=1981511 RepID=A0A329R3X5_9ACTN|nr:ABC transporter permease subunit [Actinobacteria bacterium YIM 96077]RAW18202.1 proline/glycine betaine ABC transporter permease [Phytoactinopolyspora halophila]